MKKTMIFLVSAFPLLVSAYDPQLEEALQKTKNILTNPAARSEAIKSNQEAYNADLAARNLMGSPQGVEQIYGLSADIMQKLVIQTNGNPEKLQQLLKEAQSNPKAFLESLGARERKRIKELAEQIESRKPSNSNP